MANSLPPVLRQYDRLAAVAVLAVLLISLFYLVFAGIQQTQKVQEYDGGLESRQPSKSQIIPVDLAADQALIEAVAKPPKGSLLVVRSDAEAPNLCTPERRLLCVVCAKPIPWAAKICPFCKKPQPEEKKVDFATLDSDGDGMPDKWEIAHKLNAQDPADADADADGDGFTNLEEYLAKTDPNDPKSHPGYETRMSLAGVEGKKMQLRAVNKMELPAVKSADGKIVRQFMVTFVSVSEEGKPGTTEIRAREGELIGKSGFRLVRYNEKAPKQITSGKSKLPIFINVSTIDLEREADKKPVTLTFFDDKNPNWPGEPLLEQKARIAIALPDVEPVVAAPGETFTVKGETFTVKTVDAEQKTVRIEKNATRKSFELK